MLRRNILIAGQIIDDHFLAVLERITYSSLVKIQSSSR